MLNAVAAAVGYTVLVSLLLVVLLAVWERVTSSGRPLACELGLHDYRASAPIRCDLCGKEM